MWKIRKLSDGERVVLGISGRLNGNGLSELQKALLTEGTAWTKVELDLTQVKLVDQEVVTFLACCEAGGTKLRNCPLYIREWIDRERTDHERRGSS
jgi:hypothetical protein